MRMREGMCHFRERKFKHNFQDCLNVISICRLDIESTSHFLFHCPTFNDERYTILRTLNKTVCKLLELTNYSYHKVCYMATYYLMKKKQTHSFFTQQLNVFYSLKDSNSLLFSKVLSLNLFRSFLKCFIILTSHLIFLDFYLFTYSQSF